MTCQRRKCGREYVRDGEHNPDGWCPQCRAQAEDFGADDMRRAQVYDKINGPRGMRDHERVRP